MGVFQAYFPLLLPILILELALMITALVHLFRRKATKNLNVFVWAIIIIVFEIIGPVLYFAVGRRDD